NNATLPMWSSQSDGTYTVKATATDTVGNTFTSGAVSFTLDKTAPVTVSVTAPANGGTFGSATVPSTWSGSAADNSRGSGLNADSTTFTLQRRTDSIYWTGSTWQFDVVHLAAKHGATPRNT